MSAAKKKKNEEESSELNDYIEKKINKYPKFMRKKLRLLYKDYKNGKMVFPEGYDKEKFLNKE